MGAAAGPLLWAAARLWSFPIIVAAYLSAAVLVVLFLRTGSRPARGGRLLPPPWRWRQMFTDRRLVRFLPAWIAANAILGTWLSSQLTFVVTGTRRMRGQRFVGFHGQEARLSLVLGALIVVFAVCTVGWAFLVGRLPTRPVLTVAIVGVVLTSGALIGLNHGGRRPVLVALVVLGLLLQAGFAPAALTFLADTSAGYAADRGLAMGVYSVVLGVGFLGGSLLGGAAAQVAAFDGLAVILAGVALISVAALPRNHSPSR